VTQHPGGVVGAPIRDHNHVNVLGWINLALQRIEGAPQGGAPIVGWDDHADIGVIVHGIDFLWANRLRVRK
jgi:hypothetical protein